jgi:PIN domain nuclease of toxin-antitoxin system
MGGGLLAVLLDTHVWLWFLDGDRRLGRRARTAIDRAAKGRGAAVSAITLWEVALLQAKRRIALREDVGEWLRQKLALPGIDLQPLSLDVCVESTRLPGDFHSDPADRFIVATARCLSVPLATADFRILDYAQGGHVAVLDATR